MHLSLIIIKNLFCLFINSTNANGKSFIKSYKIGSNETSKIVKVENKKVKSVRIYDENFQIGTNVCNRNNGGCDHLCLFNGRKAICKCAHANPTINGKCERMFYCRNRDFLEVF